MEKIYVTKEGLEKVKNELADCKKHSLVVADMIERARELGDLRENADYHAAKEEQAMLHARIRKLEDQIARAVVLQEDQIDSDKAYMGANVRVVNKKTGREMTYTLVSPMEMDIESNKISVRSPIGQALLGKTVGEVVTARVPAGEIAMEILEISR